MFKTEQTVEELRKLKLKMYNQWTIENMEYLLSIYKNSKKSMFTMGEIEKIEKR